LATSLGVPYLFFETMALKILILAENVEEIEELVDLSIKKINK
jgi:hypothetical protein